MAAYFSNGTEGQMYEERYCSRCTHGRNEDSCAIMNAHFLAAGEDGWADDASPIRMVLDQLIPLDDEHYNQRCTMMMEIPAHLDVDWLDIQKKALEEWANRTEPEPCEGRES